MKKSLGILATVMAITAMTACDDPAAVTLPSGQHNYQLAAGFCDRIVLDDVEEVLGSAGKRNESPVEKIAQIVTGYCDISFSNSKSNSVLAFTVTVHPTAAEAQTQRKDRPAVAAGQPDLGKHVPNVDHVDWDLSGRMFEVFIVDGNIVLQVQVAPPRADMDLKLDDTLTQPLGEVTTRLLVNLLDDKKI